MNAKIIQKLSPLLLLFVTSCNTGNLGGGNVNINYYSADSLPLYGKATDLTLSRYERLPDSLENISRPVLWNLGRNSAGLAIRFHSSSTFIAAKWEVRSNFVLDNMTPRGIQGLDLYCLTDSNTWRFAGSGGPNGKHNEAMLVENMEQREREYLLYLPLYNGLTSLSIGVDSVSEVEQPRVNMPVTDKPIVFYGSSILQGCSASRPGMAHTNMLQRWLNRECINLGFSGNALLDLEIARVMAGVDASVFVLDFLPNATVAQINERMEEFYSIIRAKHPDTPILFCEHPLYTHGAFDTKIAALIQEKNETLQKIFHSLEARGEKNIYLLPSENFIGTDGEATIDGKHFTDLGFIRYAHVLHPILKDLLDSRE